MHIFCRYCNIFKYRLQYYFLYECVYICGKHLYFYVYQVEFTTMKYRLPSCIYDGGIIDCLSLVGRHRSNSELVSATTCPHD